MSKSALKRAIDEVDDDEDDEFFLPEPQKRKRKTNRGRDGAQRRKKQFERKQRVEASKRKSDQAKDDEDDDLDDDAAVLKPPEYDKLKPPPPGVDADDWKAFVNKKPRSSEDTQLLVEYLQEQNRKITAENVSLRKGKEEAAKARDCHNCEGHDLAAKEHTKRLEKRLESKTNKIDVLQTRLARYEDRIDFLLAAMSHAEGRIQEMRPSYEFQTAEPDSFHLKIARVETELGDKDARIRELELQLGFAVSRAKSWMESVHLKDQICISLGQRIIQIRRAYNPDCSFDKALVQDLHDQVADTMRACGNFERQIHGAEAKITDLEEKVRMQGFELRNCELMMEKKHDEVLRLQHEQFNLCQWLCRAAQQASGVEFDDEEDLPLKASVFASPPKQSGRRPRKAGYWSLGYDSE